MLNRRIIRIKVFQTLFALHSGSFDLNEKMSFTSKSKIVLYNRSIEEKLDIAERFLNTWLDELYNLYFFIFKFLIDIKDFEKRKIEKNKSKLLPTEEDLNPNLRFVNNLIINGIENNAFFKQKQNQINRQSQDFEQVIAEIYNRLIKTDFFVEYKQKRENNFAEDKELVLEILKFLWNEDEFYEYVADLSTYWIDAIGLFIEKAYITLKRLNEKFLTKNFFFKQFRSNFDRDFAVKLLRKSAYHIDEYTEYLKRTVKNWDINRMITTDYLLMIMGIAEAVNFEDIPLSVSIDEYIEISKYYSTKKSYVFINGTLEAIYCILHKENKIKKSGRGLVDKFKYSEKCLKN